MMTSHLVETKVNMPHSLNSMIWFSLVDMALTLSLLFLRVVNARRARKVLAIFPHPPPHISTIFLSVSHRDSRFALLSHLAYDVDAVV